ncbi:GntR family transcriptional regulator [Nitratireductor kimnyeongensis]|uniref:GntR family transcriptional regulator n=1 Tax=Nitratireductor kimnyeongensis TaxID=430679 RepID=A0ABW0T7J4_9HYPH|nr:GntR family transcriptional regulator [Nitratireductor kimnyeongensis]QZZ36374.1 GntR family transcriptional regulator [Nitratireductor kimnyeongensis]
MAAPGLFSAHKVASMGAGPLYMRLQRLLEDAISSGILKEGEALPTERDIAELTDLSRVTVRRAVDDLVRQGRLIRRHGSGTFVAPTVSRVEQSLSLLTSFTEDMARRGLSSRSEWLERMVAAPSPDEMMVLGLSMGDTVARLERLRIADDVPMAIERASIIGSFLPDPASVTDSLYDALGKRSARPCRATQRISARNVDEREASLLQVIPGEAALYIERVSYLPNGRVIEFTRSVYRGDAYDFVAELKIPER